MPTIDELGRDLLVTTRTRRAVLLLRPLAGVAIFVAGWPWSAPLGVFVTFLCVICATHDLVHSSLGLRRNARDALLLALPALVLQSGHVYRTTHPQHHRVFPHGDDPEGLVADRGLVRTLAEGPLFLPRLWLWSFRRTQAHPRQRKLLLAEAALPAAAFALGAALLPWTAAVLAWAVLNALAGWLLPLLTVWLPHRNHSDEAVAGSLRWPVVPRLLLGLTYHYEHHLYPQVPSGHMAELARRLAEHERNRDDVLADAALLREVERDEARRAGARRRIRQRRLERAALGRAGGRGDVRDGDLALRVLEHDVERGLEDARRAAHVHGARDGVAG